VIGRVAVGTLHGERKYTSTDLKALRFEAEAHLDFADAGGIARHDRALLDHDAVGHALAVLGLQAHFHAHYPPHTSRRQHKALTAAPAIDRIVRLHTHTHIVVATC
jgi:formylmethanofuran dehydrogenase subunit A